MITFDTRMNPAYRAGEHFVVVNIEGSGVELENLERALREARQKQPYGTSSMDGGMAWVNVTRRDEENE